MECPSSHLRPWPAICLPVHEELYRMLNITPNASTAFHPHMDGQTEWVNQEVKKYFRIFINH